MARILLLEDQNLDAEIFEYLVGKINPEYQLVHCKLKEEALEVAKKEYFDCIFVDYYLTDSDGLTFTKELKNNHIEAPVAVITADISKDTAVEFMREGAFDYLTKKELSADKIHKVIQTALKINSSEEARKSAIEKLKKSEKTLKKLLYSTTAGIIIHNKDKIHFINKAMEKITGYSQDELLNKGLNDLVHFDDKAYFDEKLTKHLQEKDPYDSYEIRIKHKENKELWCRIDVRQIEFEGKNAIIKTIVDITNEKRNALEIEKLSFVAENTDNYVIITDPEGYTEYVNEAFVKKTGYNQNEILGKKPGNFLQGKDTDIDTIKRIRKKLDNKEKVQEEILNYDRYGNSYWINLMINPVFDNNNQLKKFVAIQVDISEQKRARELEKAKELAEETARFKDEFLANISHEIRTPLNGIMGIIDIFKNTPLNDEQKEYLNIMSSSSDMLMDLINDILDLSKLEAQKEEINNKVVNIKMFFEKISNTFQPQAFEKNNEIEIHLDENIPENIYVDEKKLNQIMYNLVSNANKFTNNGSININTRPYGKDQLMISVKDTGKGIPKTYHDKIFNKFDQLDQSFSKNNKGTGLGLAITRNLVNLLGGEICLDSEEGKGSEFYFTFKYEHVKESNNLNISPSNNTHNHDEKISRYHGNIILVEDKETNRKVAGIMLRNMGLEVDYAVDADDFLKNKIPSHYDLIFMDIQMPDVDGITLTHKLRENYSIMPPVIGLSANAMKGDAEKYISKGLDDYISKPISYHSLEKIFNYWLPEKQISDDLSNEKENMKHNENNLSEDNNDEFSFIDQINLINDNTMQEIQGMADDNDLVIEIFGSFFNDAEELIQNINNHIKNKDMEMLFRDNHTLKGLCGSVGASRLYEFTKYIDKKLKEGEEPDLDHCVNKLNTIYFDLKSYLNDQYKFTY